jgi:hypothetical protein
LIEPRNGRGANKLIKRLITAQGKTYQSELDKSIKLFGSFVSAIPKGAAKESIKIQLFCLNTS